MNIFNHSVKEFFLSRLACEESLHQKCVLNSLFFLKMKSNTDRNSDGFFPIHVLVPENYLNAETACLPANQCRAPVSPIPPFKQRIHFVPAHGYPPHDSVCTSSSMGQVWSAAHLTQGGDSDGQMLPTGFEVKAEQVSSRPKQDDDQMLLCRAQAVETWTRCYIALVGPPDLI